MKPRGGTMLGMSRTVTGDKTSESEYMQIREQEGRLVFTARPSGQEGASFDSVQFTRSKVVFENAAHDFPQRIIYQRLADGSLLARIEGQREGRLLGVDFPMRRSQCAAEPGTSGSRVDPPVRPAEQWRTGDAGWRELGGEVSGSR